MVSHLKIGPQTPKLTQRGTDFYSDFNADFNATIINATVAEICFGFFLKKVFFGIRGPTWAFFVINTFWFEQLFCTRNFGHSSEILEFASSFFLALLHNSGTIRATLMVLGSKHLRIFRRIRIWIQFVRTFTRQRALRHFLLSFLTLVPCMLEWWFWGLNTLEFSAESGSGFSSYVRLRGNAL